MSLRAHLLAVAAALLVPSAGCKGLSAPAFAVGSFQPDASVLGNSDPAQLAAIVAALGPQLAMYELDHKMLLIGAATLDAASGDVLSINLRDPGSGFRSPCSYWFRVPIDPGKWETGDARGFSIRLSPEQFQVAEACGSPFANGVPMVLTFAEPTQGQQFMHAMAAMQARVSPPALVGSGQKVEQ